MGKELPFKAKMKEWLFERIDGAEEFVDRIDDAYKDAFIVRGCSVKNAHEIYKVTGEVKGGLNELRGLILRAGKHPDDEKDFDPEGESDYGLREKPTYREDEELEYDAHCTITVEDGEMSHRLKSYLGHEFKVGIETRVTIMDILTVVENEMDDSKAELRLSIQSK